MKKYIIPTMVMALGLAAVTAHSVSAASAAPVTSTELISKADTAIASRIASLNKLSARIATFKHLSDSQRSELTANIQSSIDAMNTLKTKIDGETDIPTLKSDYQSITKDYRIYMLVIPSNSTISAADNAMGTISADQTKLAALDTKITASQNSAAQSAYSDATAKLADAQTQSQNLITAVTGLKPDMGDKTVEASNKTQIATAKTARKAMNADLAAVRKDIKAINTDLK